MPAPRETTLVAVQAGHYAYVIPEVAALPGLSPQAKLLWGVLFYCCNHSFDTPTWHPVAEWAVALGVSERTVRRLLDILFAGGLIETEVGEGRGRTSRIWCVHPDDARPRHTRRSDHRRPKVLSGGKGDNPDTFSPAGDPEKGTTLTPFSEPEKVTHVSPFPTPSPVQKGDNPDTFSGRPHDHDHDHGHEKRHGAAPAAQLGLTGVAPDRIGGASELPAHLQAVAEALGVKPHQRARLAGMIEGVLADHDCTIDQAKARRALEAALAEWHFQRQRKAQIGSRIVTPAGYFKSILNTVLREQAARPGRGADKRTTSQKKARAPAGAPPAVDAPPPAPPPPQPRPRPIEPREDAPEPPAAPPTEAERLWAEAVDELRQSTSAATFESWIKATRGIDHHGGTFRIGAANTFAKEWLETRLRSQIEATLGRVLRRKVRLDVVVDRRR